MAEKGEKPTKDLPLPKADQIKGGRKGTEDPDAGGEISKKFG